VLESWLSPFNGFGPDNFLWESRNSASKSISRGSASVCPAALSKPEGENRSAGAIRVGAFLQALEQNPGLEQELKSLGEQCHVYVGTGLGSLGTMYDTSVALYERKSVDRYWAGPETIARCGSIGRRGKAMCPGSADSFLR